MAKKERPPVHAAGTHLVPTVDSMLEFVVSAWSNRQALSAQGRLGLSQSLFIAMACTVESALATVVTSRLTSISQRALSIPAIDSVVKTGDQTEENGGPEVRASLQALIQSYLPKGHTLGASIYSVDDWAFQALTERYQLIFGERIADIFRSGNDDLEALFAIRNVLVHGRAIESKLTITAATLHERLVKEPIQKYHDRLVKGFPAIRRQAFVVSTWPDVLGEESVSHMYGAVTDFVQVLDNRRTVSYEKSTQPLTIPKPLP